MRRIDVIHESFFENAGDGPAVVVRLRDWRKIRRVLRAAELLAPTMRIDGTEIARNFCEAFDALNKEPKK